MAVILFRIMFQCGGSGLGPLGFGILSPKPAAKQCCKPYIMQILYSEQECLACCFHPAAPKKKIAFHLPTCMHIGVSSNFLYTIYESPFPKSSPSHSPISPGKVYLLLAGPDSAGPRSLRRALFTCGSEGTPCSGEGDEPRDGDDAPWSLGERAERKKRGKFCRGYSSSLISHKTM